MDLKSPYYKMPLENQLHLRLSPRDPRGQPVFACRRGTPRDVAAGNSSARRRTDRTRAGAGIERGDGAEDVDRGVEMTLARH